MKALRIVGWDRYETADSRKCRTMQWVAVPINHDGLGYIEMMSHPEGIRMIGGWLLILQLAARCPVRGVLVSDGGRVLGAREIALKLRAPQAQIEQCIEALVAAKWIEEFEYSGSLPDTIPTTGQHRTAQDSTGEGRPTCVQLQAALKAGKAAGARAHEREALDEWIALTTDHCGCEYDADAAEAVTWMIKRARAHGTIVRWAREVADQAEDCRRHITAWKKGAA